MVRRWSYLNSLNASFFTAGRPKIGQLLYKHQYTLFKTTTYYRNKIYEPTTTRLTRYSFFRRRHMNNWLLYTNVLNSWSNEYLFFRKYLRCTQTLFFFKTNYITLHLALLKAFAAHELPLFRVGVGTFLTSKVFRFLTNWSSNSILHYRRLFTTPLWLFTSAPTDSYVLNKPTKAAFLYQHAPSSVSPAVTTSGAKNSLSLFLQLLLRSVLAQHLSVYKIFITLFQRTLSTNLKIN